MNEIQKNSEYIYLIEKQRYMYRGLTCTEYAVRRYTYNAGQLYLPSGMTLKKGNYKQCLSFCKRHQIAPLENT